MPPERTLLNSGVKNESSSEDRPYPDLHDHLKRLDRAGLLITVDRPINKDTEMHPLVRWQFRGGIEEKDRKAFLFTNVTDSKGRKYNIPVVIGALAANREIYRLGMGCELEEVNEVWQRALAKPIPPQVVSQAPCHEIVILGEALDKPANGLDGIPIPISTPGWDVAPYTTLSQYITKHPDNMDELQVAGGLVGAPINVVKAKTVDLLVPAEAEIVIEGLINTEELEPEAPFGESHGHVNLQEYNAFMDITCITRRREAILTSIISQVTPSESSLIKRLGMEPLFLRHLRNTLGIRGVRRVSMHEPLTNLRKVLVLVMERTAATTEIWRALYGAAAYLRSTGKYIIAVNDDIDPDNADALLWAMSYRANPDLDLQILRHRDQGHGPRSSRNEGQDASVLIDATLKENFPPISLPKREFMERAKQIWEELGLPKLKPEAPWFGYSLGEWPEELERAAELAVNGDYFETGKLFATRRRSDVRMNTEVAHLRETPKKQSKPEKR